MSGKQIQASKSHRSGPKVQGFQQALRRIDTIKHKNEKDTILFFHPTPLTFVLSEKRFRERIAEKGLTEFIFIPKVLANGVPTYPPEHTFALAEPNEQAQVNDVLTARQAQLEAMRDERLQLNAETLQGAALARENLTAQIEHRKAIYSLNGTEDKLRSDFEARHRTWEQKQKEFLEKQQLCHERFTQAFDPQTFEPVRELVGTYRFAEAWHRLADLYAGVNLGTDNRFNLLQSLNNLKFDSTMSMQELIDTIDTVVEKVNIGTPPAEGAVGDADKLAYMLAAIKHGDQFYHYKDRITHGKIVHWNYTQFKIELMNEYNTLAQTSS